MHLIRTPFRHKRTVQSLVLPLLLSASSLFAATYSVTSTADSGPGTLRQAMLDANENPGPDEIHFSIAGSGVRTITPLAPLPAITDPVTIDGRTQPGYSSRPLIELNGTSAGAIAGLRVFAGNTTIRGLVINRFGGDGIRLEGAGTNVIQGNFVGLDAAGLQARGNAQEGIIISGSWENLVGGTAPEDRNVVAGSADAGIYLLNGGGNIILGNYIGTASNGTVRLPNGNNGIVIYNSRSNVVGGVSREARNLISGNIGSGIHLFGSGSRGNIIQGNYLGLNATGTAALSNSADGITISGAPANFIGGSAPGSGNVSSGNGMAGVYINGAGASANELQGNSIGTDAAGLAPVGNVLGGIVVSGATLNRIGGVEAGAGNLIAGNRQDGILLNTNANANRVEGNCVGANAPGKLALPNGFNGITISSAHSNVVGGTTSGARNLISGNQFHGVHVLNGSDGNQFLGNYIGTDPSGFLAVPNAQAGIRLDCAGSAVGGLGPQQGNLISGNASSGVLIVGLSASNNVVAGNFIGLASNGAQALANGLGGVGISGAPGNLVLNNILSGNNDAGVFLISNTATRNRLEGNRIGTDVSGWLPIGNQYEGIYMNSCGTNYIGAPGNAGNLVSGNRAGGILLTNASGNLIQGNWVGLKSEGTQALGNTFHAIECASGSRNNVIGGGAPGEGNRLAFSQTVYAGVRVRNGATGNTISGNTIFSNGGLGIDLGTVNATLNDACDADTGANELQNFPVLLQVVSGNGTQVRGTLNSRAGGSYRIQVFASPESDPSGYGEGAVFLGEQTVSTGAGCETAFTAALPASDLAGRLITATATDAAGNTSEFSRSLVAEAVPVPSVQWTGSVLLVSWPSGTTGFVLKSAGSLTAPIQWTLVPGTPVQVNGKMVLTVPPQDGNQFFVLAPE